MSKRTIEEELELMGDLLYYLDACRDFEVRITNQRQQEAIDRLEDLFKQKLTIKEGRKLYVTNMGNIILPEIKYYKLRFASFTKNTKEMHENLNKRANPARVIW